MDKLQEFTRFYCHGSRQLDNLHSIFYVIVPFVVCKELKVLLKVPCLIFIMSMILLFTILYSVLSYVYKRWCSYMLYVFVIDWNPNRLCPQWS